MKKYIFPILTAITLVSGCSSTGNEVSEDGHSSGEHQVQSTPVLLIIKAKCVLKASTFSTHFSPLIYFLIVPLIVHCLPLIL
ncbi:hypothetical protein M4I42_11830 [Anoxybacillus sp. J5B_2022]|nr:hypothetical protein [Anoxybacillus sp. J5B_2022]MCZ0756254.1 hypothetical protein [Anoxybacillus sp. J5B_2022]